MRRGTASGERRQSFRPAGGKSTGLGLAIVRKVAEEHGGSIGVESRVGQGSVFTIRLLLEAGTTPPG